MTDRDSAQWMKREDERILEYLDENGLCSARLISNEVFEKVSAGHVSERLGMLKYAGLVDRTGLTSYELTEAGQRYLSGDLDAAHQPTPSAKRVLQD
jgi:repressor of nif and glnA expression